MRLSKSAYEPLDKRDLHFLTTLKLLLGLPNIDIVFHIILWFLFLFELLGIQRPSSGSLQFFLLLITAVSFFSSHMILRILSNRLLTNMGLTDMGALLISGTAARILLTIAPFFYLSFYTSSSLPIDPLSWVKLLLFSPSIWICLYIASFVPSTLSAIKSFSFTETYMVLLLPVMILLSQLANIIAILIFVFILIIEIAFITFAIPDTLEKFLSAIHSPGELIAAVYVTLLMISVIVAMAVIFGAISSVRDVHRYYQDWHNLRWWQKIDPSSITGHELINWIASYHLPSFCVKFIRVIRRKNIPKILFPEIEILLTQVILDLEEEKRRKKQKKKKRRTAHTNVTCTTRYTATNASEYRNFLAKANADVLDELNQWLENLQDQRSPTS